LINFRQLQSADDGKTHPKWNETGLLKNYLPVRRRYDRMYQVLCLNRSEAA
jgi:hypothetical protein